MKFNAESRRRLPRDFDAFSGTTLPGPGPGMPGGMEDFPTAGEMFNFASSTFASSHRRHFQFQVGRFQPHELEVSQDLTMRAVVAEARRHLSHDERSFLRNALAHEIQARCNDRLLLPHATLHNAMPDPAQVCTLRSSLPPPRPPRRDRHSVDGSALIAALADDAHLRAAAAVSAVSAAASHGADGASAAASAEPATKARGDDELAEALRGKGLDHFTCIARAGKVKLASGAYGFEGNNSIVFIATLKGEEDGEQFCLKALLVPNGTSTNALTADFRSEYKFTLHERGYLPPHENILSVLHTFEAPMPNDIEGDDYGDGIRRDKTVWIVTRRLGSSLAQWLSARSEAVPIWMCISLVRQLCAAVAHLVERSIVHRDIKSDNLLVDTAESSCSSEDATAPRIVLHDWGNADRFVSQKERKRQKGGHGGMRCHFSTAQQTRGGAPCTLAPEIADLVYAEDGTAVFDYSRSDLYSAGLVALEIVMCGRGGDEAAAAEAIPEVWAIVQSMLVHEPSERATPRKVIAALDALVVERGTAHGRTEEHQFFCASLKTFEAAAKEAEAALLKRAEAAEARVIVMRTTVAAAEKKAEAAEATKEELRTAAAAAWEEVAADRDAAAAEWGEKNMQREAELVRLRALFAQLKKKEEANERMVQQLRRRPSHTPTSTPIDTSTEAADVYRAQQLTADPLPIGAGEWQGCVQGDPAPPPAMLSLNPVPITPRRSRLTPRGSSSTPARSESAASSQASAGEALNRLLSHRGSSSTPARSESAASSQASAGEARKQPGQRRSSLTPGGGSGSAASPQASASGARNFRSAARRVVEAGRSRLAGTPRTPLSTKAATPLSSIVRSGIRRRKSIFDHDHNLDSETQLTGSPSLRTPTGTAATRALNLTPSTDRYEDVGKPLRKLYFRCGHISYNDLDSSRRYLPLMLISFSSCDDVWSDLNGTWTLQEQRDENVGWIYTGRGGSGEEWYVLVCDPLLSLTLHSLTLPMFYCIVSLRTTSPALCSQ